VRLSRAITNLALIALVLSLTLVVPTAGASGTTSDTTATEKSDKSAKGDGTKEEPAKSKDVQLTETVVKATTEKPKEASTATIVNRPRIEIAQDIEVVDNEMIEERGASTYYETLSYVSGVSNGGKTIGSRTQGWVTLRGFAGSNVTLNGAILPKSMPVFFDSAAIGSVEFLKGTVGSTSAGNNNALGAYGLGGSVNINTLRAEDFEIINVSLRAKVSGNKSERLTLDYNTPLSGELALRTTVAYETGTPYYLPDGIDGKESFFISESLVWKPTSVLEIYFSTTVQKVNEPAYQGLPYLRGHFLTPADTYYGTKDNRQDYLGYTFQASGTYNMTDNIDIQVGLSYIACDIERSCWKVNNLPNADDKPGTSYKSSNYSYYEGICDTGLATFNYMEREATLRHYAANVVYLQRFDIGATKHQFVFASDWYRENTYTRSTSVNIQNISIYDPNYDLSGVTLKYKVSRANITTTGFVAQDIMEWGSFRFLAGARYDFQSSAEGWHGDSLSPRVGVTFMCTETCAIYGNYSRSEVPNFRYNDVNGDPLTAPWTGNQVELGVKKYIGRSALVSLCGFNLNQENTPQYESSGDYYYLGGKTESTGIELTVDGKITRNWKAFVSYSYTNHLTVGSASNLPTMPRHSAAVWQTWTFSGKALEGLKLGLGAKWSDSYYSNFKSEPVSEEYTISSYVTVDLFIEYAFDIPMMNAKDAKFRLFVENLFDEEYVESIRHATDTFPGAPRTIGFSFSLSY